MVLTADGNAANDSAARPLAYNSACDRRATRRILRKYSRPLNLGSLQMLDPCTQHRVVVSPCSDAWWSFAARGQSRAGRVQREPGCQRYGRRRSTGTGTSTGAAARDSRTRFPPALQAAEPAADSGQQRGRRSGVPSTMGNIPGSSVPGRRPARPRVGTSCSTADIRSRAPTRARASSSTRARCCAPSSPRTGRRHRQVFYNDEGTRSPGVREVCQRHVCVPRIRSRPFPPAPATS